jgi:hypothetical protein
MLSTAVPIIPSLQPAGPSGDRVIDTKQTQPSRLPCHKLRKKQEAFKQVITYLLADHREESSQLPEFISALRTLKISDKDFKTAHHSEEKLKRFFEDALNAKLCAAEDLVKLSTSILKLKTDKGIKNKVHVNFTLDLLNKIITQRRILAQEAYTENKEQIASFRQVYKLTVSDKIFRYAIGFNAGLGSGSVIYGIATTLLLNPLVMAVSGGISLLFCGIIANYFLKSYSEEDEDLTTKLNNFEKIIQLHSMEEAALRLESYDLINQLAGLISKVKVQSVKKFKDYKDLLKLHATTGDQDPLAIDHFINKKLQQYSSEISTVAQVNNIQDSKPTSIYTRIFHSKHWGPILNFFGATGTVFGVAKTILAVVGVTALLGSPISLMAVIAAAAITFSIAFAFKHWRFNKLSEKRKEVIKDFELKKMDGLSINTDKLKKLKEELQTDLANVKRVVGNYKFEQANLKLALDAKKLTATKPHYRSLPCSPTASPSNNGMFCYSQSPKRDLNSESSLNDESRPRIAIC